MIKDEEWYNFLIDSFDKEEEELTDYTEQLDVNDYDLSEICAECEEENCEGCPYID